MALDDGEDIACILRCTVAQWLGAFTGNTHETRVGDAEDLLLHAVEVLKSSGSGPYRERRAKSVARLAKRLLAARLKLAKARIAAAEDVQTGVELARRSEEIASLKRREALVRQGGLEAILKEFGAEDGSAG